MTRKEFLRLLNLGIFSLHFSRWNLENAYALQDNDKKIKNWLWLHSWCDISDDEYKKRFEKIKLAGINAILPNIYASWDALYQSKHLPVHDPCLEKFLPIAKSMDLDDVPRIFVLSFLFEENSS